MPLHRRARSSRNDDGIQTRTRPWSASSAAGNTPDASSMVRDEIASEARGGLRADLLVFVCLGADLAEDSVHHFHELSTLRPFRWIMTRIEERSAIRYH